MAAATTNEIPPCQTLYINNLNDKLAVDALKSQLYMVFSQYGKVDEVIAFRGKKGRGQAWIVYKNTNDATAAMRSKQGFNFYDKPLVSERVHCHVRNFRDSNFAPSNPIYNFSNYMHRKSHMPRLSPQVSLWRRRWLRGKSQRRPRGTRKERRTLARKTRPQRSKSRVTVNLSLTGQTGAESIILTPKKQK